ncbi:MAG TPA: LytR C-terminal domain-containing protein [Sphingomicrobium sp.]|nr:LytR C-terminal domain-containing protein [Sphingomicrobium sp.]
MNRGGKFLVPTTVLALVAGCGQDGKLEIRSTPTPLAEGKRPVPARVAEGRGQLAMGNVGLALTSFRLALRDDPNSTDALVGMAMCYDQMTRYDLSRRNYEAALAVAPNNLEILAAFVSSLQLQGKTNEAIAVRQEIAARAAASAALDSEEVIAEAEIAPVQPVYIAAAPEVAELAPRAWAPAPVELNVAIPEKVNVAAPKGETGRIEVSAEQPAPAPKAAQAVQSVAVGRSVSIKLPPARPVQQVAAPAAAELPARHFAQAEPQLARVPMSALPMRVDVPVELANTALTRPMDEPIQKPSVSEDRGPRLERMSMGEIALITVPRPVWASTTVAQTDRSATVRFVPLRVASANAMPVKVRLLNAARVNRLAAQTRTWLNAKGWRGLAIGNAMATRSRSIILYPADKRVIAQRLATQFGFPIAPRASGEHVIVLLGSDAVRKPARRSAWA